MEGFSLVLLYWINTTTLAYVRSDRIVETKEACESILAHDIEARRKIHGNATGYCIQLPDKPEGLPKGPPVFKKPTGVDV